jgi:Fe-S-cluster containining protein
MTTKKKKLKTTEKNNPCFDCKGQCCNHVAVPIDKPTTRDDFGDIRWYVSHKNVQVFVEDGDWYLCFLTPCRYLTKDYLCSDYDNRPKICRDYDPENCERHGDGKPYDHLFNTVEEVEAYAEEYLNRRRARSKKGQG